MGPGRREGERERGGYLVSRYKGRRIMHHRSLSRWSEAARRGKKAREGRGRMNGEAVRQGVREGRMKMLYGNRGAGRMSKREVGRHNAGEDRGDRTLSSSG